MIIDSHCHLHLLSLGKGYQYNNIDEVIAGAIKKSVSVMINVSINLEDVHLLKTISRKFSRVYYTVGIHPSEAKYLTPDDFETIKKVVMHDKCVAVGETGLDYNFNNISHSIQKSSFEAQIMVAKEFKKPIIVHTRSASKDTIAILKSNGIENCGGVLHSFTEDWETAKKALDMGMYISFSGIVTFKNAKNVQNVAKKIPLDRILIETDAPYLTPHPYRGKPNYPEYLMITAKFLSELRSECFTNFCSQTKKNTEKIFKL